MKSNSLVFFAGIPTEPDVKRLREAIGIPNVGALITYEEIEGAISSNKKSSRFKSVVAAWRRELDRDHNVILIAIPNNGYEVADSSRRVHLSSSRYKHGLRRICKAGDIACRTDTQGLSQGELRARDHVVSVAATLRLTAATAAKQLKYPDPVKSRNVAPH